MLGRQLGPSLHSCMPACALLLRTRQPLAMCWHQPVHGPAQRDQPACSAASPRARAPRPTPATPSCSLCFSCLADPRSYLLEQLARA